jgi:hypothetical protein
MYITVLLITMNNMLLDPISSKNCGDQQDKLSEKIVGFPCHFWIGYEIDIEFFYIAPH